LGSNFFFQRFVSGLAKLYPEIFEDGIGGDTTQHQINFAKKWKSYTSIIQLANGDITKIDEVVQLPLEKCLLFLCYQSDKAQTEELVHKQMLKKIQHS
jgi:hypothetical protein